MKEIGDAISANILQVHGQKYTSQKSIQLYVTSGFLPLAFSLFSFCGAFRSCFSNGCTI